VQNVADDYQERTQGGYAVKGLWSDGQRIYGWVSGYWGGPAGSNEPRCFCPPGWSEWHPVMWSASGKYANNPVCNLVPVVSAEP
jgi:hypothetical protein